MNGGREVPAATAIPGYVPGSWEIDSGRSVLGFSVKHLGVQTVRGTMQVKGRIVVAEDPADSTVAAIIDLGSVETRSAGRDKAIRSAPLFDVASHPTAVYHSNRVTADPFGDDPRAFVLDGDLTFMGVTRAVPLRIHLEGFDTEAGRPRLVVTGCGQISRADFGLVYRVRPRFLDKAIGQVVDINVRLEGSP